MLPAEVEDMTCPELNSSLHAAMSHWPVCTHLGYSCHSELLNCVKYTHSCLFNSFPLYFSALIHFEYLKLSLNKPIWAGGHLGGSIYPAIRHSDSAMREPITIIACFMSKHILPLLNTRPPSRYTQR